MKVTVIEVDNNIIGVSERLEYIENEIKKVGKTDFVVLSELSTPGYIPNENIWEYAENNGEITKKWAVEMAKKYNIYIGAGFVEKENNDIYNSYLIANKEGVLGTIKKNEPESNIFKRGKFPHIINTPIGNIAVGICFDAHKKEFYENIKNEEISMILMPHAWAMDKKHGKDDREKINTLVTKYNNAFDVPVIFANAVGDLEQMAGITGKLMNPKVYKLLGQSTVAANGKIIEMNKNENILTVEFNLQNNKRKNDITFHGEWIDKGSFIFRNVVIPLDIKKGIKLYNKGKKNNFKKII